MAFIPTPFVIKVALRMTLAGSQQGINTLWFKNDTDAAWTAGERSAFASLLQTWWTNNIAPLVSASVRLEGIDLVNQDTANAPATQISIAGGVTGAAGVAFALNTALVASWRTDLRGRSFRGRFYTPGIPTAVRFDDGTITTAFAGQLATAFGILISPGLTGGVLSVVSHFANNAARGQGLVTPVTAVIVETLLDSMRRRLIGRGA